MLNEDSKGSGNLEWVSYNSMQVMANINKQKSDKYLQFKEQIKELDNILTLEEAREFSNKIIPLTQECNQLMIGDAICIIVNRPNMLRFSLDTSKEYICYDFV